MNILGVDLNFPFWSRNKQGDNFYDVTTFQNWAVYGGKLNMAENHPILTPALLFVSKLFSQADIWIEKNGKRQDDHEIMKLLRNPNFFQTLPDMLESLLFTQRANGVGVLYIKRTWGTDAISALYVLNFDLIEFPDQVKKGVMKGDRNKLANTKVKYDKNGEDLDIKLGDLLFFYDLPNGIHKNPFKASSIIDGLKQTLLNTQDSLIAKNIILKSNGKEMLSGSKDGFPLDPDEKAQAEQLFNSGYGLSPSRRRGLITKANVTWKSLHIALRDLGLDESVKVDGNIIYTALHIPKDILSLEAKKTTYNNFKESMVSYLQNEMQTTLNSLIAVFNKSGLFDDGVVLKGTYEHLPIMQYILLERYKGVSEQAGALTALRKAGVPDEVALEMCGMDPNMKLGPLTENNGSNGKGENNNETNQTSSESSEESKIRRLVERA